MRKGLFEVARRQHGAFTVRQARGWYSDQEVRTRLRSGQWSRLHKGVLTAGPPSLNTRLAAAGLAIGAPLVACLHSAAELHGFGVVATDRVHVIDPGGHLPKRDRLMLHQLDVPAAEIVQVDGLAATEPARTAVELARRVDRSRALAVLDAALHSGTATVEQLADQCERQAKRRGIVEIRRLLPHDADGRAESPMESATRLVCLMAGLPAPQLQFPVLDGTGRPCRYLDLAWPDRKVALEYDGVEAHTGPIALRRDRARHNFLVERGWTIIYATADDVRNHPHRLVRRIRAALDRAA